MSDADLLHHYKVLKQFLDISDNANSRTKLNSSRAARAREKLLRLSGAQFRELSTDVYDELRRRIDESRSEPDYLLPKLTFHPKRNQARQKLSSLPQSRFKDLVSDISFEIERRNFHNPPSTELPSRARQVLDLLSSPKGHTPSRSQSSDLHQMREMTSVSSASPPQKHQPSLTSRDHIKTTPKGARDDLLYSTYLASAVDRDSGAGAAHNAALRDELTTPDLRNVVLEQPIGLQPTTVIPAKAQITWSSDEDEGDGDDEKDPAAAGDRNSFDDEPRQLNLSSTFSTPRAVNPATSEKVSAGDPVSKSEHDQLRATYGYLRDEHEALIRAHTGAKMQLAEATHAQLAAEHDLDSLKRIHADTISKHQDLEAQLERLANLPPQKDILPSSHSLEEENARLKCELDVLRSTNALPLSDNQGLKTSGMHHSTQNDTGTSSSGAVQVNAELRKLHVKLGLLPEESVQTQFSRKETRLRNEISQWQKKYEALKAGERFDATRNPASKMDLAKLCAPDGSLSYKAAVVFFLHIDAFYASLDISSPDADLFFERISSIALSANKIAGHATRPDFSDNGHADAIRESASHALTATRYFVVYPTLMPKVIVERAVSEVAFAVCDAVSALKFSYVSENEPWFIEDANDSTMRSRNGADNEANVKPLRITQRILDSASRGDSAAPSRGQASAQTSKLSPIQSHVKGQSLPIAPQMPAAVSNSTNVSKLSSRNLFGGSTGDQKSASMELETQAKSPIVTPDNKAGKVIDVSNSKTQGKQNGAPVLFDKVKNFEKLATIAAPGSSEKKSVQTTAQSLPEKTATKSAPLPVDYAPTRNKSIFQSLKDRFLAESPATPETSPAQLNENTPKNDGTESGAKAGAESKTEADSSFKEIATPSKKNPKAQNPSSAESLSESSAGAEKTELRALVNNETYTSRNAVLNAPVSNGFASNLSMLAKSNASEPFKTGNEKSLTPAGSNRDERDTLQSNKLAASTGADSPYRVNNKSISSASGSEIAYRSDNPITSTSDMEFTTANEQRLPSTGDKASISDKSSSAASDKLAEKPKGKNTEREIKEVDFAPKMSSVPEAKEPALNKNNIMAPNLKSSPQKTQMGLKMKSPSFKVRKVSYEDAAAEQCAKDEDEDEEADDEEEKEIRQRQDYRKSIAAATFNFDLFDIDDPDNTVTQVLLYLEHQTVQVISTIQDLLSAIKKPDATTGELRENSSAISEVIRQMTEATNTSMNQTRNFQLKEHGTWVVKSLEDCNHRMDALCKPSADKSDADFADRHFKQRLAGISFDIAKCTKELVKTVEEASLKEDIAHLDAQLSHQDDLT